MRINDDIRALVKEAGEGFDLSRVFTDTHLTISELRANFMLARNQESYEKFRKATQELRQMETRELADREARGEQGHDRLHLFVILLSERIAELDKELARRYEKLKEKYGDDVIGGMSAAFLSEEQLADLTTDAQRYKALRWHFLDEDGDIRPGYEGVEEAEYIELRYEKDQLAPLLEQAQNGHSPAPSDLEAIATLLNDASVADHHNAYLGSDQTSIKQNATKGIEEQKADNAHPIGTTLPTFD